MLLSEDCGAHNAGRPEALCALQSMSLAVVLMGLVNVDAEAVAEMRREAALEYERKVVASQIAWDALWVAAGLPATCGQPSYLTIGHVSEGHPIIPHGVKVAYAEADKDIGMVICMGETFKYKIPQKKKIDDAHIVSVKGDLAMRRVRPTRSVDKCREQYVMHRWTGLSRRLILGREYWTLRMACRWQNVMEQTLKPAQRTSTRCIFYICRSKERLQRKFCRHV